MWPLPLAPPRCTLTLHLFLTNVAEPLGTLVELAGLETDAREMELRMG